MRVPWFVLGMLLQRVMANRRPCCYGGACAVDCLESVTNIVSLYPSNIIALCPKTTKRQDKEKMEIKLGLKVKL